MNLWFFSLPAFGSPEQAVVRVSPLSATVMSPASEQSHGCCAQVADSVYGTDEPASASTVAKCITLYFGGGYGAAMHSLFLDNSLNSVRKQPIACTKAACSVSTFSICCAV